MTDDLAPVQYDITTSQLQYNNGAGPVNISLPGNLIVYNSISSFRASGSSTNVVFLDGYYSSGDTGKLIPYWWNSTDTRTDNGGTIIQVTGISTGRYNMGYLSQLPIDLFGAKTDGTDAQTCIQSLVDANLGKACIPPGIFTVSGGAISLTRSSSVIGIGAASASFPANSGAQTKSVINHNHSSDLFTISGVSGDVNASCGYGIENILLRQSLGDGSSAQGTAIKAVWTSDSYTPTWIRIRDLNIEVVPSADQWQHGIVFDGGTSSGQNLRDIWIENTRIYVDTAGTDAIKIVNCANVFINQCLINGAKGTVNITGSSGYLSNEIVLIGCNVNKLAIDYAQQVNVIGGRYGDITFTANTGPCQINVDYITNLPTVPSNIYFSAKYCQATGGPIQFNTGGSGSSDSGTWSPTCSAGTITVGNATYSKSSGLVYVNFDITMPTSSSSSQAIIAGLPYISSVSYFNGSLGYTDSTVINSQGGAYAASATSFSFRTAINAGYATFANLSGKRLIGSFTYST